MSNKFSRTIGLLVVGWVAFLVWVAWGLDSVRSVQRPSYTVSEQHEGYEVRQYKPFLVAQIPMKGPYSRALKEGTHNIAEYLAGANTTQSSVAATILQDSEPNPQSEYIARTAGVLQEDKGDFYLISAMLPSRYTMDTIPRPNNPEIRLVQIASATAAVLTFTGAADQDKVNASAQRLRAMLESDKQLILSPVRLMRYSPPWTPSFLQSNEVIFTVR